MQQERLLQALKQKNTELTTKFGVKSLSLFGSVTRNETTSTSDMDLLVEFNRPMGYFGLFALKDLRYQIQSRLSQVFSQRAFLKFENGERKEHSPQRTRSPQRILRLFSAIFVVSVVKKSFKKQSLRGLKKVETEWGILSIAHNLRKLAAQ